MKKVLFIAGTVIFMSVLVSSCGNSIESDAKKTAELQCKAQKLVQKASSGDQTVLEESQKLSVEAAELAKEMEGKYTSEDDQKKYAEALSKEMGNCN